MKQKHILLFSQARQGHHAVMEWLCQQSKTGVYYNNLTIDGHEVKHRNWGYDYTPEGLIRTRYQKKPMNVLETTTTADIVIYNFINQIKNIKSITNMFSAKKPIMSCVVRDLYNFVASLKQKHLSQIPKHISNWKLMIEAIFERKDIIDINYNKWFEFYQYRVELNEHLGILKGSLDLPEHSIIGQSPFEPRTEPKDLKVLDRWKYFKDDDNYWKLFDKEAIALNKQYFGFSYKQE